MQSVDRILRKDLDKVDTTIMSEWDRYNFLEVRRLRKLNNRSLLCARSSMAKAPDNDSPQLDAIVDGLNVWVDRMDRLGFGLDELSM